MAKKPLPSPEVLRQLLRYEPEAGELFWKERPADMFASEAQQRQWNRRYAGRRAFCTVYGPKGYLQGCIADTMYMAHRVVYAFHVCDPGDLEIDHINGDRTDNRIENLRAVSPAENARNMRIRKDNKSGAHGVSWVGRYKRWVATINANGKHLYVGHFTDLDKAVSARKRAEAKFGYHENHGRK